MKPMFIGEKELEVVDEKLESCFVWCNKFTVDLPHRFLVYCAYKGR